MANLNDELGNVCAEEIKEINEKVKMNSEIMKSIEVLNVRCSSIKSLIIVFTLLSRSYV